MNSPEKRLLFGDFQVLPTHNELLINDARKPLPPRSMEVLVYLIMNNDRVVSNDELLAAFWSGLIVEESTIHRVISQLRSALGDSALEPKYIKTVSKRGYQAVAEVSIPREITTSPVSVTSTPPTNPQNITSDPEPGSARHTA